jgi:pSer/pThr/pTyr-binding forkhead associated (FHA) protein
VSRQPGRAGRQFPLQAARNTIGRDGSRCQVVLDDPTVSSEHAAIVFEHGRFVLYDLASTNGTYLNDQRIQRQMLYDGDEVRLGKKKLVFKKV